MHKSLLLTCLTLTLPLTAAAQDSGSVTQEVRDLSKQRADRLRKALDVAGGALYEFREETGAAAEEIKLAIRWDPTSSERSRSGWSLRGRLKVAIMKNPDFVTNNMLRASYRYGLSWFENTRSAAEMKFVYNKVVHVRYRASSETLHVTMDGEEEHGAFNMTVSEIARSSFRGAGGFGVATGALSLDVSAEESRVTVIAAGLPYVVRPHLRIRTIDDGDYMTVEWGLLWESRVRLEAEAFGARDDSSSTGKLKMGWGEEGDGLESLERVEIDAHGYSERSGFTSRLTMEASGDGYGVSLVYDERVPHRAYDLVARANQRWHVHVEGTPIIKSGSIQEERSRSVGKKTLAPWGVLALIEMPWLKSWSPGDAPGGNPAVTPRPTRPAGLASPDDRWLRIRTRYCPEHEPTRRGGITDVIPGYRR